MHLLSENMPRSQVLPTIHQVMESWAGFGNEASEASEYTLHVNLYKWAYLYLA